MNGIPPHILELFRRAEVVEWDRPLVHPIGPLKAATELATAGSLTVPVRALAGEICRNVRSVHHAPEAIAKWVRASIQYRRETPGIEVLSGPISTVRTGHGDCDDLAILWASLCQALGIAARPCSVGWRHGGDLRWAHMIGWLGPVGGLYELSIESWYSGPRSRLRFCDPSAVCMVIGDDGNPAQLLKV